MPETGGIYLSYAFDGLFYTLFSFLFIPYIFAAVFKMQF